MAAKFEIRSAGPGKFTWVLVSQGRTLASGEPYARRAIQTVRGVGYRLAPDGG